LSQWQHWQVSEPLAGQPEPVARLGGGRSNYAVRVSDGRRDFAVRLDGLSHQELGLNRAIEQRAQRLAAEAGLAPVPCYFNPDLGVLVSDWHEPDASRPGGAEELAATGELLRAIHALPPVHYRLKPMDRARRYLTLSAEPQPLASEFLAACERLAAEPTELKLCHNDLLAANRLFSGGKLTAVDWEYAAMGDPLFDLAAVIEGDGLAETEAATLLEAYGLAPRQAARLSDQRAVYRYLAELWEAATQG
jgi:aminoglycoside phosphotransferase (APT) family kinase protein